MKKVKKLLAMMTAIVLIGTEFCGAGRNVYAAEPVNDMAISDTVGIADVTDAITDDLITDTVTGVEDMFNEDAADTVFAEEPEEETGPEGDLIAPEEDVVSQGEGLDTYNEEDADTEEAPDEDYIDDGLQPDGAVTFEKTVANTMFGTAGMASPRAPLYDNDGWQGSYVYYGKYAGKPVKYRVLDKQTTDFNKPENTSPTMFLDCNGCVYDHRYDDANHFSNWKNSELRSGLNGSLFLNGNVFTEMEKEAITES